jgi:hypothetical protein
LRYGQRTNKSIAQEERLFEASLDAFVNVLFHGVVIEISEIMTSI